nr:cytochrome P450 4c3-like isoform X1 [Onthophagus taurus]XP_022912707.1 cytochrome P450 4c3-like isoform X1 [Onthophagus taurus]
MYLVLILFAVFCLQLLYTKKWKYKSMENIPGPPPNILIGNMGLMKGNIEDMFHNIISLNKTFGKFVKIWVSPITPKIVIADPGVAQKVLNSSLSKSSLYNHMFPFLGNGLVTSHVDLWRKDRKLTNVAFNTKLMDPYNIAFEYHGNQLVSMLYEKTGLNALNIVPFVDLYALDVICETMIGVRTHILKTGDMEYLNARSQFLTIVMNRTYSLYKGYNFLFKLTNEYRLSRRCEEILRDFSKFLISEYMKTSKNRSNDDTDTKNVFEIITEAGLTGDRLIDHVNTFVVAGQDTPASTIAYALYEIAHKPEIQRKVVEESVEILGRDKNVTITRNDMHGMVYLEALIKEALRHYPAVPMIERTLDEDLQVSGGVVPAGTDTTINIYAMHHDEEFFKEPNKFDPDRFLPENSSKINLSGFLPFSKGSRDCIGKTFAMYQMKSVITKVVRNFELLPADPPVKLVLTSEFVMKSSSGNQIRITPRQL